MAILGKDVAVYYEGELVALSKSCSLSVQSDLVEVANPLSGGGSAKRFMAGKYGWSIDVENLVLENDSTLFGLIDKIKKREDIYVFFTISKNERIGGTACIKSINVSGALGSVATYKAVFTGNGSLSLT